MTENKQPKGVQEDERSLLIDYYVQKVSGRLRQLRSPSESDKKRWVWELLQNAKDCISNSVEKASVDVEIIEEDDWIIFKHNGEPFTPKALNSLIWQKSGEKRGNSESTGRFGTGFLTTHTLSQNVFLESVLIDTDASLWGVSVNLCREGERDEELREGIKKTLDSRKYFPNPTNHWTTFKYQLKTQTNKESATAGIKSLRSNIFFTLAFADKINSIKLVSKGQTIVVTRIGEQEISHFKIVGFLIRENGIEKRISVILDSAIEDSPELSKKYKQERQLRYSVAIQVLEDTKKILPILPDTPYLYCVFPLVGTEEFYFPVVVNSPDFEPVQERDRLLLAGNEYDEEKQEITNDGINKLILSKALSLYSNVLTYLSSNDWKNIHLLAMGAKKPPMQDRDFDKDWYKEKIQTELRQLILSTPIVETSTILKNLNDIYFPKADGKEQLEKIWKFTNDINPEKLPKFELIGEWAKLIWEDCHAQTIEELTKQISEFQNIKELNQDIEWLDSLLHFIIQIDEDYLNKFAIIPNVNGDFKTLNYENLSTNNSLPDSAFKLLFSFGVDWKDIIVKKEIKALDTIKIQLSKKGYKEFSEEINNQIKQKAKNNDETLLNSIFVLLSTIPTKNDNISVEFIEKRKTIWSFAKDIFGNNQPDIYEANDLDDNLWERCDEWVIPEMIKAVSVKKSLNGLIELNEKLDIYWINKFIGFVTPFINKGLITKEEYNILPDQYGNFKSALAKDDNISSEFKDNVFVEFGIDLKSELLDNRIDKFNSESKRTITEVATRINDLLKSNNIDSVKKDNVVFKIISLLSNEQDLKQKKIWEYARVMYGGKIPKQVTLLENSHPTLWNEANNYLILKIIRDIEIFSPVTTETEQKSSVSLFSEYLKGIAIDEKNNWYDFTIIWLNNWIEFLDKNELSIGAIVPNQNDIFFPLDKLDKDNEIPEELKNILCKLDKKEDFRTILIHKGISIQPTHTQNTKSITSKINDLVEKFYKEKRDDEDFKEAINLLVIEWFNTPKYPYSIEREFKGGNDTIHRDLFKWAFNHRFELETNVLSSIEERKYLYGLNSQIRQQQIPFEEIKIISKTEYENLVAEVAQLKAENITEVESLISKYGLTEDKIKLLLEIEEQAKRFEGTSNFLEHTAQELINSTGIKGEEIVYEYLSSRFNKERVRWVSRSDKNDEGIEEHRYDFEVLEDDLQSVMWYIDAKATLSEEYQSDKIPILIRQGTWNFIRESEEKNIFLARVFGARNANSEQVQLLKIQYIR